MENINQPDPFYIGLTMAGAASAGCYTGGVMDYMFEILDLWEKAKKAKPDGWSDEQYKLVPQHQVVIDVMGGTSAGGMTTSMAAIYALQNKMNPVKDYTMNGMKENIFYDSWVMMDDDAKGNTFQKLWDTDDLKEGKIRSLLNSGFIDSITSRAFTIAGDIVKQVSGLPSYISKDLQLLQSHCLLQGIPLTVDFGSPISKTRPHDKPPTFSSFDHFTLSHYHLNKGIKPDRDQYLWLNPYDATNVKTLMLTTQATGAFPVGLRFREIDMKTHFTPAYLENVTNRIVKQKFNTRTDSTDNTPAIKVSMPSKLVTIDGGAINNEPFDEVLAIMKKLHGEPDATQHWKYGLIMIDPFPDKIPDPEPPPDELNTVIPSIIGALWDQSKVKRAEMLDAYSSVGYLRTEIYPKKRTPEGVVLDYPIACDAVMAFSGLLSKEFRHHDFFLGRNNARTFFQYFFSLEYFGRGNDKTHPIHRDWSDDMVNKFKVHNKDKTRAFLPIIPDLNLVTDNKTAEQAKTEPHTIPHQPLYNAAELFAQRDNMKDRFEKMILVSLKKAVAPGNKTKNPLTDEWIKKYYRTNFIKRAMAKLGTLVLGILVYLNKGKIANKLTKAAIEWVLKDLEKKGLLAKK